MTLDNTNGIPQASEQWAEIRETWLDEWRPARDIVPDSAESLAQPSMSHATFTREYGQVLFETETEYETVQPGRDLNGWFIRICDSNAVAPLFVGQIARTRSNIGGSDTSQAGTGKQTLTAYGLEMLLKKAQVRGSYIIFNNEVVQVDTVLSFNMDKSVSGLGSILTGNRSNQKQEIGETGRECFVFSADSTELWTARDIIEYLLVCWAPQEPVFELADSNGTENMSELSEAWQGPSDVLAGINQLVRRQRGHSCSITVDSDMAMVNITPAYANDITVGDKTIAGCIAPVLLTDTAPIDLPPQADGADIEDPVYTPSISVFEVEEIDESYYDRIVVEGEFVLNCGTVSGYSNLTLIPGWNSELQMQYQQDTDTGRKDEKYRDVFSTFILPFNTSDYIFSLDETANRGGCPTIKPDGNVDFSTTVPLFKTGKRLSRQLPFKTDTAATPYKQPTVWVKFTYESKDFVLQVDRMADTFPGAPGCSITLLNDRPGFRINGSPRHLFGLNSFTGTSKKTPLFIYQNIMATVAFRADNRLRYQLDINPTAAALPTAKILTLRVPGAECWIAKKGTITEVTTEVIRLTEDTVLRNDRDKLAIIAAMAKAWYGRRRKTLTLTSDSIVYDCQPGSLVKEVLTGNKRTAIGTVISSIKWNFADGTTTIQTDWQELDFRQQRNSAHHGPSEKTHVETDIPIRQTNPFADIPVGKTAFMKFSLIDTGIGYLSPEWDFDRMASE